MTRPRPIPEYTRASVRDAISAARWIWSELQKHQRQHQAAIGRPGYSASQGSYLYLSLWSMFEAAERDAIRAFRWRFPITTTTNQGTA